MMVSLIDPRIVLLVGALSAGAGGFGGWKLRDADYQRHLKKDAQLTTKIVSEARATEQGLVKMSSEVRAGGDLKEANTRIITRTITEKVPVYVTATEQEKAVVAGGGLPLGFVQLYNAGVLGVDPSATASPNSSYGDPSGVDLSTLARVEAGNLEVSRVCRSRLADWDTWYDKLVAAWPKQKEPTK